MHDNGRGFSEADLAKPRAFGIRGIQERAYNLGGEASLRCPGSGAEITVRVPRGLEAETAEADEAQLQLGLPQAKAPSAKMKNGTQATKRAKKVG